MTRVILYEWVFVSLCSIAVSAYRLLYLHVCGFPVDTCDARDQWEGWRFCKGELWSPENVGFSAGEIGALQRELDARGVPFDDNYKNVVPFLRRE